MGLSLVIDADVNDYSVTNGKFDGFKVLFYIKVLTLQNFKLQNAADSGAFE